MNQSNYQKINQYLLCCSQYNSDPEEMTKILELNYSCLLNLGHYSQALRMALKLDSNEKVL